MTERLVNTKTMSPRTKKQLDILKEERKSQIMEVAIHLFAENGFHATSIEQIATKAGISKGLVYNYFDSKEAMLKEALDQGFREIDEAIAHTDRSDPKNYLEELLNVYFQALRQDFAYHKLLMQIYLNLSQFPFYKGYMIERYEQYYQLLHELLKEIGLPEPKEEARVLTALLDGIAVQYLVMQDSYPLDRYQNILVSKYCKT